MQAARSPDAATAARRYAVLGLSVLPLRGKRPALPSWAEFQRAPASPVTLERWASAGRFHGVGIVCGAVSGGLVVLDLDGEAAYAAFTARFPHLVHTYTVATGSGRGYHLYFFPHTLPRSTRALRTALGNLELRADRLLVVAPPSAHPATGLPYRVHRPLDVLRVENLDDVAAWIERFKPGPLPSSRRFVHRRSATPNPHLIQALAGYFLARGYRRSGGWLNGRCIYPERHAHGDRRASFGFHVRSGVGFCFVCGAMPAGEIAQTIGLGPTV